MANKRMCKWYDECDGYYNCPKNTNDKCEIIPPRRKRKVVKGWVREYDGGIVFADNKNKGVGIPCTISYEEPRRKK